MIQRRSDSSSEDERMRETTEGIGHHGAATASSDMTGDKHSYKDDERYVREEGNPRHDAAPIAPCPGVCRPRI